MFWLAKILCSAFDFIKPLNAENSAQAVALIEDGRSLRYVSTGLHCTYTAVRKHAQRFRETGRNTGRPGSGKKEKELQLMIVLSYYHLPWEIRQCDTVYSSDSRQGA